MYVRSIRASGGRKFTVGKFGIVHIDVDGSSADVYTAGGNIFNVRVKKILDNRAKVTNSRNAHKNLY